MSHHATADDDHSCHISSEKRWSIALYTFWSFSLWGRRLPPEEREKIRFQHRLRKRIALRMMNVLRAGFGEGTPQQVSDRRHKKRGSGFLWHRSILALSTFAHFIRLQSMSVFRQCAWTVSAAATFGVLLIMSLRYWCCFSVRILERKHLHFHSRFHTIMKREFSGTA